MPASIIAVASSVVARAFHAAGSAGHLHEGHRRALVGLDMRPEAALAIRKAARHLVEVALDPAQVRGEEWCRYPLRSVRLREPRAAAHVIVGWVTHRAILPHAALFDQLAGGGDVAHQGGDLVGDGGIASRSMRPGPDQTRLTCSDASSAG